MSNIIRDPAYLAYKFNFNTESVEYLQLNEDEIRSVPWLRHADVAPERPLYSVPLKEVIANNVDRLSNTPLCFIFHTAYCASTYLSRSLDVPGHSLSLREPQLLLDAANAKRLAWVSKTTALNYENLPSLFLNLLIKQAEPSEKLIIKPINSVNNIVPELLSASPNSKAVMLYTDVRNFALSALKKGEASRQTIRSMFDLLRCDFPHLANLTISNALHMSDLKLILTFWRLQLQQAETALELAKKNNQMCSVYAENLIARPEQGLLALNVFLKLGLQDELLRDIVQSDANKRDAKDLDKQFSVAARAEQYAQLESVFGEDLNNGLSWMQANNPQVSLSPTLSGALNF